MQEDEGSKAADTGPAPETVRSAIVRAQAGEPPAFYMDVSCVDERGARSLRVFRSGTSIWNRSTQIVVPAEARRAYLAMLQRADYATMAKSYGGKKRGAKAALVIRCEVSVDFGDVQKTSVQLADGEQSPRVEGLAAEILDYTESLGLKGEPASSLQDALGKWVSGRLHPEVLNFSIVQMPLAKGRDGLIVEVRRGEIVRRHYAPGRGVGHTDKAPLNRDRLLPVLNALLTANFVDLPPNLMFEHTVEINVAMLGHRKKVIARRFGRALPEDTAEAQERFDRMMIDVKAFAGSVEDAE